MDSEMTQHKPRDLDEQVLGASIRSCSRRHQQWKKNDLLSAALQTLPKQFKKKNVFKCGSLLLITLMFAGLLNSISKAYAISVRTQMCIVIDGSGSINETKWTIIKNGIAEAINIAIPKDGSVELSMVQFGYSPSNGYAKTELTPAVVDGVTCAAMVDIVLAMPKSNQCTPMAHGILLGWTELRNSPNFAFSEEQIIILASDGAANIRNNYTTSDLDGSLGDSPNARDDVIAVVDYAVSQGLDELDVEGVDIPSSNIHWLKNWVIRPRPAHLAPPFNPGWIAVVTDSSMFAETLGQKFNALLADTNPPSVTDVYQLPYAGHVNSTDTVRVYANVADDLSGVRQVVLNYTVNGSASYLAVMSHLQGDKYNASIPAFAHGTHVMYVLIAEDFANNSVTTQSMGYESDDGVILELSASLALSLLLIATVVSLVSLIVYGRTKKPRPSRALATFQVWLRRRLTFLRHGRE